MDEEDGNGGFPSRMRGYGRRGRSGLESLITGLAVAAGSAAYWFFFNRQAWWVGFIFLFGGVLPAARGLQGMITARLAAPKAKRQDAKALAADNERIILRLASSGSGKVTPAIVALNSSMSMEEAEAALDAMAKRGHASMRVRDDGRVEYEFSEFLPI